MLGSKGWAAHACTRARSQEVASVLVLGDRTSDLPRLRVAVA